MIAQRFAGSRRGHDDKNFAVARGFNGLRLMRVELRNAECFQRVLQRLRQRFRQFAVARGLFGQVRDVRNLVLIVGIAREFDQKLRDVEGIRHSLSLSR